VSVFVYKTCRVFKVWMEERPPIWKVAANILNKQSRTADMGCSPILEFGEELKNSQLKKKEFCYETVI